MSFLSRSKLNLSENNSTLLSRLEDSKSKPSYSQSPLTSDLMGSLDGFRQGLRKQLTEKLTKTPSSATNNSKFLEVPSPKNSRAIKEKYDIGFSLKQRNSPIRVETSYGRSTPGTSSQKHFDLMKDLNRKIEERSPPRKNASRDKDLTLLASFDKKFTGGSSQSQSTFISPSYRSSLISKSTKSPLRDYFSTLESKTPEYRRSQIFEKTSNRTPKDIKHSLIKILDNTPKRSATESASKLDSDRPHSALSQAFNQLRSSRIQLGGGGGATYSPERKEGTESLKSLSHFVSESFKNREKEREVTKKSGLFNGHTTEIRLDDETASVHSRGGGGVGGGITEKFTMSKIYELQDMFQGAGEKEFNHLSSDYIEELIKLSSIIMQRVKTSSYYNRE